MPELANMDSAEMKRVPFIILFLLASLSIFCEGGSRTPPLEAALSVKVFPQNARLLVDGVEALPVSANGNVRRYVVPRGYRVLTLGAAGYREKTIRLGLEGDFFLEEKLERSDSRLLLLGETPTGVMPKSVVFTGDGSRLLVPLLAENGVDLIPAESLSPRLRIELTPPGLKHRGYVESVVVRNRDEIWVSQMDTGQVHILCGRTFAYKDKVDTKGRWSKVIALSADERLAFVSNWLTKDVSVVDVASRRVLKIIPVTGIPRGMAATADGRFLYVCVFDSGNIDIIDLENFGVVKTLRFGPGAKRHIVLDDRAGLGYTSDMATGRVTSFSLKENKIIKSLWAGHNLNTLTMSGDGRFLFASSRGRNNPETYLKKGPDFGKIVVIDAASMKIVDWVWGRNQPTGLAVSPDNTRIAFTDFLDDNLEVYDISGLYAEDSDITARR